MASKWTVAFGRLRTWLSSNRKQPNSQPDAPANSAQPPKYQQQVWSLSQTFLSGWHPDEQKHRSQERRYWRFTLYLSFVVACGAGGSAYYAYQAVIAGQAGASASREAAVQARRQADIAQDTLIAGNRPWVMLTEVKPASLSSDDEAGVNLWVNISAKNVGHSPAQNVSVSARLLMDGFDAPLDQAMVSVCQEAQGGSFIIPGQVLFPDQDQDINQGIPFNSGIKAERVRAARVARIKSTYDTEMARGKSERAQAMASELAKFPFYAPLNFVGCINYRSSDNKVLYQTGFMFDVSRRPPGDSFPLLGGKPPVIRYPEPEPGSPDVLMVFPREMQRILPGDQVKLGKPLYSTFAN